MKKFIVALLSTLLLLLAACDNQPQIVSSSPNQTVSPQTASPALTIVSDFFPFTEDVYMRYTGQGNEYAEFETYVDYVNGGTVQIRAINPGTESVSVYVIDNDALKKVYSDGETYYRLDYTRQTNMDEILIKEPIEIGTTWTLAGGAVRSITAVDSPIIVPYGAYKALEITTSAEGYTTKDYYVSGIGLVKQDFISDEDASVIISSLLETVENGTPLELNLRFYYPDLDNDRLVYIEKPIELYTGTRVPGMFEQQMKQVPTDSGLHPLMSENTVILGLNYNKETGVASIDLSADFIGDMNVDSALEGLTLASIANTLGSYFQTDKVSITIEGNDYASEHFLFKKGDYLISQIDGIPAYP